MTIIPLSYFLPYKIYGIYLDKLFAILVGAGVEQTSKAVVVFIVDQLNSNGSLGYRHVGANIF